MIERIAIVGSGNVAWHLGHGLQDAGLTITGVFSRNGSHALEFAHHLSTKTYPALEMINDCDLIVVAVSDDQTKGVMESLPHDILTVHTSGMLNLDEVECDNVGTFYPLQTFSKSRQVDLSVVPICIESRHAQHLQDLEELAGKLTEDVRHITSQQRQKIHLAAVFVSNFVNHMYRIGGDLIKKEGIDFSLLKPLIGEVAAKIDDLNPADAQTGPARRKDYNTINKHLQMLDDHPEWREIYQQITNDILSKFE